jgi:hypothetical protein
MRTHVALRFRFYIRRKAGFHPRAFALFRNPFEMEGGCIATRAARNRRFIQVTRAPSWTAVLPCPPPLCALSWPRSSIAKEEGAHPHEPQDSRTDAPPGGGRNRHLVGARAIGGATRGGGGREPVGRRAHPGKRRCPTPDGDTAPRRRSPDGAVSFLFPSWFNVERPKSACKHNRGQPALSERSESNQSKGRPACDLRVQYPTLPYAMRTRPTKGERSPAGSIRSPRTNRPSGSRA